jgi:hypothetical protein
MKVTMEHVRSVIDPAELMQAAEDQMFGMGNSGFCVGCGAERDGCEPDARKYECFDCGENGVYGASELVLMGLAG